MPDRRLSKKAVTSHYPSNEGWERDFPPTGWFSGFAFTSRRVGKGFPTHGLVFWFRLDVKKGGSGDGWSGDGWSRERAHRVSERIA